ncbi:hypothetical protein ACLIYM_19910 [Streptomyces fenghuangensis]|uniref:Uncharacterized protein n=1 Tax=Streptomyces chitinivorans TaxID=1257027 RepID=A0ABW7HZM4_9ACTN
MTRVKRILTAFAMAVAITGVGAVPALAENHTPIPSPSQPAGN